MPLVEEAETAKLFPASNRARDVRDGLLALAARQGARFLPGTAVTGLARHGRVGGGAPGCVAARRGCSGRGHRRPLGTDDRQRRDGLAILEALGHTIHPTYRGADADRGRAGRPSASLSGVSLPVTITAQDGDRRATPPGDFSSPIAATADHRCWTSPTSRCARGWRPTPARSSRCAGRRWMRRTGRRRCDRGNPHGGRRAPAGAARAARRRAGGRGGRAAVPDAGAARPGGAAPADRRAGRVASCRGPGTKATRRRR